ncbi:MAG TPA: STM4015 family protein [Prosthecobacter sp.]
MLNENLSSWLGHPVIDYAPGTSVRPDTYYRFRIDWDAETSMEELLNAYTADPAAAASTGLVIGAWFGDDSQADSTELVRLLADARHALPKLEAIFFGDVISEENEISWINQTDVSPLFEAYPALKHLVVRGGSGLSLGGSRRLESLQSLTIQTGGLPATVLHEVWALDLPQLESLELWLGTDNYGWDGSLDDLLPLLSGDLFPSLKHLALRNSEITDQIAEALVASPLMDRIESLDLSLGTLKDLGAAHLAGYAGLKRLKSLDLHHHYCTAEGMNALRSAYPGVNLNEKEELDEDYAYVAVGE